ncbi:MAG: hypothetical protein ABIT23_07820 [Nitrosospira sp.]
MTENIDPINQIIEDVAVKHAIALGRDDPILVVYTINRRLMESSAKIQLAMLDEYRTTMESIAHEWETQAVHQANSTLEKILDSTKENIVSAIRAEMGAARDHLAADYQKTRRDANLTLFASILTLIAAAIVLWSTLTL